MASGKEIRKKIKSVQSTQKITRAMEMVAASKMRKAQDQMRAARPYADKMRQVIAHLAHSHAEYRHPFMVEREVKRVGMIVITSDRGLCGGLNVNLMRGALAAMREWSDRKVEVDLCTIGAKGLNFFRKQGFKVVAHATHIGDVPRMDTLLGAAKVMTDAYAQGRIDRLVLVYNRFINNMTQQVEVAQFLPLPLESDERLKHHWDYLYEPDAHDALDFLLTRYLWSLIYHAVVENFSCEQGARMMAMKSASDNAGTIIGDLRLSYNKARQSAITQELSEIVGGAAAV